MGDFRKFIITPEGYGIILGVGSFLVYLLLFKYSLSASLLMGSGMGFISGIGLSRRYKKERKSYFVHNIENNKHHVTRSFNKLLRKGEVPANPQEYDDYLKFLDSAEKHLYSFRVI